MHQAKAALERADAEIQEAEAQLDLTRRDYERYSTLLEKDVISRREFENVEAKFSTARARMEAARKTKEEARALSRGPKLPSWR